MSKRGKRIRGTSADTGQIRPTGDTFGVTQTIHRGAIALVEPHGGGSKITLNVSDENGNSKIITSSLSQQQINTMLVFKE